MYHIDSPDSIPPCWGLDTKCEDQTNLTDVFWNDTSIPRTFSLARNSSLILHALETWSLIALSKFRPLPFIFQKENESLSTDLAGTQKIFN